MCAKDREKHRNKGFVYVFWGLWEQDFDAFCALAKARHAGVVCFEMSYFIDYLLFRWKIISLYYRLQLLQFFLRGVIILIIYITIYILISYRVYKEGIPPRFLTVITVIVIAGLFTSLQGPSKPFGSRWPPHRRSRRCWSQGRCGGSWSWVSIFTLVKILYRHFPHSSTVTHSVRVGFYYLWLLNTKILLLTAWLLARKRRFSFEGSLLLWQLGQLDSRFLYVQEMRGMVIIYNYNNYIVYIFISLHNS